MSSSKSYELLNGTSSLELSVFFATHSSTAKVALRELKLTRPRFASTRTSLGFVSIAKAMRHKDLARRTRGLKALGLLRNPHSEKGLKALVLSGRFVKRSFTHPVKPLKGPRVATQLPP